MWWSLPGPPVFSVFVQAFVHRLLIVPSALGAVPLAFGLVSESHTREVKPFDWTLVIVTADHLTVGHLLTQTVGGLVGVDGEVDRGGVAVLFGLALLLLGRLGLLLSWWREGQIVHRIIHQGAVSRRVARVTALAVPLPAWATS